MITGWLTAVSGPATMMRTFSPRREWFFFSNLILRIPKSLTKSPEGIIISQYLELGYKPFHKQITGEKMELSCLNRTSWDLVAWAKANLIWKQINMSACAFVNRADILTKWNWEEVGKGKCILARQPSPSLIILSVRWIWKEIQMKQTSLGVNVPTNKEYHDASYIRGWRWFRWISRFVQSYHIGFG